MYSSAGVFHSLWNHWRRISLQTPCTHGMTPGFCHSASATLCVAIAMLVPCMFRFVRLGAAAGCPRLNHNSQTQQSCLVSRCGPLSIYTPSSRWHCQCASAPSLWHFQIYGRARRIYTYSCYRICGMAPKNFPPNTKYQSHIRSIPYPTNPRQFQGSHQIIQHYILRSCANDEHRLCARVPQQHRCCFMYFSQWCT